MITITLPTWLSQVIIWSWVVFSVGMAVGMVFAMVAAIGFNKEYKG